MNKRFLSAVLFGAFMVTSTGTFVSCKDYDDEIDQINKELTDIKSQIAALQTAVDNGDYVTGVAKTADGKGMTFTFSKGSPVTVTLDVKDGVPGEPGKAAQQITFDATTGAIMLDGEATGFFAAKDAVTGKFAVPEIGEDGFWYVVNEEGKLEATSYKASPISAVQDPNTKAWTLKVWNAETKKYDEISLPTAASLITDFELLGLWDGKEITSGIKNKGGATTAATEGEATTESSVVNTELSVFKSAALTEKQVEAWKGPKSLVEGAYLISSGDNMLVRIAPSSLDASGTQFNIVNSKNNSPLGIALNAAVKFDGVLTRAAGEAGLYTVGVKSVMFTPASGDDITKLDNADVTSTLFALQDVTGNFTSPFTLGIQKGEAVKVEDILVNKEKVGVENKSKYSKVIVELNKDNTVTFENPAGVYDSYITYSDADKKLFGLTHDDAKMTFKASVMPDIVTKATFDITIHYLTVEGETKTRDVEVKVNSDLSETAYDKIHPLVADNVDSKNPNFFAIDLQTMKDNMGETNYAIFAKNVKLENTKYTYTHVDADGKTVTDVEYVDKDKTKTGTAADKGITELIVKEAKAADNKESSVTAVADAKFIKFVIDNDEAAKEGNFKLNTKYTVNVSFRDKAGEELTTVKVTFTLTVPALKDLLTFEPSVYNADAKSLFAYMTEGETIKESSLVAPKYTFKYGFKAPYAKTVVDNSIEFTVDEDAEYAKGKKVSSVAKVVVPKNDSKESQYAEQYIVLSKDGNSYPVYAKDINVHIAKAKYLNVWDYYINEKDGEWYSFNIRLMSPITCDQASIAPADGVSIKIPATGSDKGVFAKDFKALTYNKQPFSIFANEVAETEKEGEYTTVWKNEFISDVQFKSTNTNVFVVKGTDIKDSEYVRAVAATLNEKHAVTTESHVLVSPKQIENETTENMEVVLTDIWGFAKKATVAVTVQRDK